MWLYLICFRLPMISLYVNHALHGPATINTEWWSVPHLHFNDHPGDCVSKLLGVGFVSSLLKIGAKIVLMGHGNPWNYSIVFFSTGIQHSRVYPAFCNQKFLWLNSISIHVFGKMKCRKLPTPFSWDCDLDQGSSTQSPHKKHARIFKKNSQQGEIGWNEIKPSWDSDFQCIFNWKKEPFVELSQRC